MAPPRVSTRQRAIALAALLSDDRDLAPLGRLATGLGGPARALATGLAALPRGELARALARETASLLGGSSPAGRCPGVGRLVAALDDPPRPSPLPEDLAPLGGERHLALLAGLSASLLARAEAGSPMPGVGSGRLASAAAEEAGSRLAPAVAWLGRALAHDEAAAEALAAAWQPALGRALERTRALAALETSAERAELERARLRGELAGLG